MSKELKKLTEVKLFGQWSVEGIEVVDAGLARYISLAPILTPHTSGRHEHHRFGKSALNIAERLVDNLMRPGKAGGKKAKAIGILMNAFNIIHLRTGKNPLEVLVRAVENAAPCEDVTRIAYGGIVYPISVDISPQRRIDLSLRFLAEGARKVAFSNPKTIDECLAEELALAAAGDTRSYAVKKRDEMERVALSSR